MKIIEWKGKLKCPRCGCEPIRKCGLLYNRRALKQRYQCMVCDYKFVQRDEKKRTIKQHKKTDNITGKQARETIKKVLLKEQVRTSLLFVHYINEIDDVLTYYIPARYKVVIVRDIIKNLRNDKRFE